MSSRIRATAWEWLNTLHTLYSILKEAYSHRKQLVKGAKLLLRVIRWSAVKSLGLTLTFFGGLVLCVLPIATWFFAQATESMPRAQIVPSWIGIFIALLIYALGGLLLFGAGLWVTAPKHRAGRFGRRLVLVHVLRRRVKQRAKQATNSFTGSSRFGLIHRLLTMVRF